MLLVCVVCLDYFGSSNLENTLWLLHVISTAAIAKKDWNRLVFKHERVSPVSYGVMLDRSPAGLLGNISNFFV